MDSDEPTDWSAEDFPEDGGADLGTPDDPGLSDPDLGYPDPGDDLGNGVDAAGDAGDVADSPAFDHADDVAGADGDIVYSAADAPGPDDVTGPDPAGDDTGDTFGDAAGPRAEVPGTDPDADPLADDTAWDSATFPESLDLEQPPEPVDGMPWSDAALLGGEATGPMPDPAPGGETAPPVGDLYSYDGGQPPTDGSDPWQSLRGSEDPATGSLARFWGPA